MPRFKVHAATGFAVGAGINVAKQLAQKAADPKRPFDIGEMFLWGVGGAPCASIPDLLEPALNPHHRGFFHSVTFGAALIAIACGKVPMRVTSTAAGILKFAAACCFSHLVLDFCTPRSLPLLGCRLLR